MSFWFLIATLVLLVSCTPAYVEHDYDRDADFSSFETFYWSPIDTVSTQNPSVADKQQQADTRLRTAVKEGLEGKGLRFTADDPDLFVVCRVALESSQVLRSRAYEWYGGGYRPHDDVLKGTIFIALLDNHATVVWRGLAEQDRDYDRTSPKDAEKAIREGVNRLLDKYPPK